MSYCIGISTKGMINHNLVSWLTTSDSSVIIRSTSSVVSGRNEVTRAFLSDQEDDWLVYLDDDTKPQDDEVFDFLDKQQPGIYVLPYLLKNTEWSFCPVEADRNGYDMWPLSKYKPSNYETYELKQVKLFSGSGICIHREMLEKMQEPYWVEPTDDTWEDVLFSFAAIKEYNIPAYVILGSALHHYKKGLDLLRLTK